MTKMLSRFTGLALLCSICNVPVAAQEALPSATVQRAQEAVARVSAQPPRFQAERYNPAVLHLRFTSAEGKTTSKQTDSFLDITLISPSGQPEGVRAELALSQFRISSASSIASCRVRMISTPMTHSRHPGSCTSCCLGASLHSCNANRSAPC